ncbi:MAG: class I SAM-dependent methyltransferase [Alphaproteobacteria bacterium]|nr:class I SAM-dependent methyltransferase [Alphaproteobacteria bacterium]
MLALTRRIGRRLVAEYDTLRLGAVARQVRRESLTYLAPAKLRSIEATLDSIRARAVPGDFLEFGVALGGSAIVIARRLDGARRFIGFDRFARIPPPGPRDPVEAHRRYAEIASGRSRGLGGRTYYGYLDDLQARVVATFARHGLEVDGDRIRLVAGLFEETLPSALGRPVAFAHVDCDWYDPVRTCLEALAPVLSPGGAVVLDDYNDYAGCRAATHDVLDRHDELALVARTPHAIVVRR